jgi:hypothetical protein
MRKLEDRIEDFFTHFWRKVRLWHTIQPQPQPLLMSVLTTLLLNPAKASHATNLLDPANAPCQLSLITCTRVSQHWKFALCARRKDTWPGVMADQEAGCRCHNQVKCTFDSKLGQIHKEEALDLPRSSYHSLEVRSTHTKVNWWVFM